ncbi:MAG: hypothetical protein IT324_24130 [Anaerolineae bacterium]|nr:hypothetical protein [Anaerolineae bacterium]
MPIVMSVVEMNDLAQKLAKMSFNRAKGYIRGLDKRANLDMFRVAVGVGEWHTRFSLPTKGLWITLIEQHEEYGQPDNWGHRRVRFKYIEARVEPLPMFARQDIYSVPYGGVIDETMNEHSLPPQRLSDTYRRS